MITKDKVIEIFCIIDEFTKNFNTELEKNLFLPSSSDGSKRHRRRKGQLSQSEVLTIMVCYHYGSFRNFKSYYLLFIRHHLADQSRCKLSGRTDVHELFHPTSANQGTHRNHSQ